MSETELFGLRFFTGTQDEAAEAALALIRARRGAFVVTPNPEIVLRAERSPDLAKTLRDAALCLPDGVGLVWASRLAGRPLRTRIPGVDFAAALMEKLERTGGSVYLLGARPGVAALGTVSRASRFGRAARLLPRNGGGGARPSDRGAAAGSGAGLPGLAPAGAVDAHARFGTECGAARRPRRGA